MFVYLTTQGPTTDLDLAIALSCRHNNGHSGSRHCHSCEPRGRCVFSIRNADSDESRRDSAAGYDNHSSLGKFAIRQATSETKFSAVIGEAEGLINGGEQLRANSFK